MDPVARFRELVSSAAEGFRPHSDAPEIIPFGTDILNLVRAHPEAQTLFEQEFIAATRVAPPELLEFCMHALRWPRLRAHFQEQQDAAIARNDWRAEPYYRHLLEAFDDDWQDATDFYGAYFNATAQ